MKRTLIASVAIAVSLAGCATVSTEVAPRVAKAVQIYCVEAPESRALIRSQVNSMIAPATIRVTCPGDAL